MRRLREADPFRVDLAIALAALAATTLEVLAGDVGEASRALTVLGMGCVLAPIAFRRRAPLAALSAFWASAVLVSATFLDVTQVSTVFVGLLFLPYAAGSRLAGRASLTGLALSVAGVWAINLITGNLLVGDFVFPAAMAAASWFAGRTMRERTRLAAELHEEARRARDRREAEAQRAVAEERRRIAREMHDVVAHGVSVMVVQAGGARRILDTDPQRALDAAVEIERAGREALGEMRRLLGILRPDEEDPAASLAPGPSLADLDALVAGAREAGLPVTVAVEGTPRPVPLGMDVTAYRIVQEGLTNALKHAGPVPTEVRVTWAAGALELEVADHGPGPAPLRRDAPDGGHGLVGMRERVRLYGGELETGRRPGGGFVVRARLPLDPVAEAVAA